MTSVNECSSCYAPIRWVITPRGKRTPLDRDPVPDGNVVGTGRFTPEGAEHVHYLKKGETVPAGKLRYVSHFANCPEAREHRKR